MATRVAGEVKKPRAELHFYLDALLQRWTLCIAAMSSPVCTLHLLPSFWPYPRLSHSLELKFSSYTCLQSPIIFFLVSIYFLVRVMVLLRGDH